MKWWWFSVPVWIAAATTLGFLLREKHYSFGIAVVVILLLHCGSVLAWDVVIEKVRLNSYQWVAILMSIVAMVLYEVGNNQK